MKETATTTSDAHDLPHAEHGKKARTKLARYDRMMARRKPKKGQPASKGRPNCGCCSPCPPRPARCSAGSNSELSAELGEVTGLAADQLICTALGAQRVADPGVEPLPVTVAGPSGRPVKGTGTSCSDG